MNTNVKRSLTLISQNNTGYTLITKDKAVYWSNVHSKAETGWELVIIAISKTFFLIYFISNSQNNIQVSLYESDNLRKFYMYSNNFEFLPTNIDLFVDLKIMELKSSLMKMRVSLSEIKRIQN